MRKLILFSGFFVFSLELSSQVFQNPCSSLNPKVSFRGKAPWNIDGSIVDWVSLLGPVNNIQPLFPFSPPASSAFNWASDILQDGSAPPNWPTEKNIAFTAFMHDDFNVYYYFRRAQVSSSPFTFFYFLDVDYDGFMDEGEPVVSAVITNNSISSLKLNRYMPSALYNFIPGRGNNIQPALIHFNFPNQWDVPMKPMPGTLVEVFNSATIPKVKKLRKNELFSAALTENGMGVELAIPWRYLRYWLKPALDDPDDEYGDGPGKDINPPKTSPLHHGDIFFYMLALQTGNGIYSRSNVVDAAGNCCNHDGRSGNEELTKTVKLTTVVPGLSYKLRLTYHNPTNAEETYEIQSGELIANPAAGSIPDPASVATIMIYTDKNCNGKVDQAETGKSVYPFTFESESAVPLLVPGKGKACQIVLITFPPGAAISSATVKFNPFLHFSAVPGDRPHCEEGGGKAVNQVGFVEEELGGASAGRGVNGGDEEPENKIESVIVYPNPSTGTVNIALPKFEGTADILVQDISGRTVKHVTGIASRIAQVKGLQTGFYIIKVKVDGKEFIKKIIVQ